MPSNKPKIAILTTSFPRFEGDFSGHFIHKYALCLARSGHDIEVIAPHHPRVGSDHSWSGLKVQYFRYFFPSSLEKLAYEGGLLNRFRNLFSFLLMPLFLGAFFISALRAAQRVNILHAHWLLAGLVAIAVKSLTRVSVVLTLWGSDMILLKLPLIGYFFKLIIARASAIVCESRQFKQYLESQGIQGHKISVIPNGHDLDLFRPDDKNTVRAKLSLPVHKFIMLTAGRLVTVKGQSDLIKSLPAILQHTPSVLLVIVGEGELRDKLMRLAKSLGVAQYVIFTGHISSRELPHWLNSADLFVLPSLSEGRPNILIEAMSCGLPVVATRVGGITEMIRNNIDGILVPPKDPQSLATSIMPLISDPALRNRIGRSASQSLQDSPRTWDKQATEIAEIYVTIKSPKTTIPPKILTVYYKHKPGGFCKRLKMSIEAYLENGHEVHYIAVAPYPYSHENLIPHILPTFSDNHDNMWFWIYFFLIAPWFTLIVGIKEGIGFISSVSPLYACICGVAKWVLRLPQLTFIFSKPKFTTGCHEKYRFMERIEHFLESIGLCWSEQILANSKGSQLAWIAEYGSPAKRIEVFPNNVDDPPFDRDTQRTRLCAEFGLETDSYIIATSGILEPHKNMKFLISAFSAVQSKKAVLLLIGDGIQRHYLQQYAVECGIAERTIFPGWRTDVLSLLQGTDLYVFPSLREGMSDALLEAMTCRIPCLISAIPENMEVISNHQQHFSPHDIQALTAKINRCIEDKDFYEQIRQSTLQSKARFVFDWKERLIKKSGLGG